MRKITINMELLHNVLQYMSLDQIYKSVWNQEYYDKLTIKAANIVVIGSNGAGIGHTTKMNCFSWGIPASKCKTGRILSKDKTMSCSTCYSKRGNYLYDSVQKAEQSRLDHLQEPYWIESISYLINKRNPTKGQFRWFDSGDLQDHEHLLKILQVVNHTPQVKHWLPTQEHELITEHVLGGWEIPSNITIRLSTRKIDGEPPLRLVQHLMAFKNVKGYIGTSRVTKKDTWKSSTDKCPSSLQKNNCGACSKCWQSIPNIDYKKH